MEYQIFNQYVLQNLYLVLSYAFLGFIVSFFITPWIGKLAAYLKVYDLPKLQRKITERGYDTRIHTQAYPKLGGLSVVVSMILIMTYVIHNRLISIDLVMSPMFIYLSTGAVVIVILGFLDDKYEISSTMQLFFQFLAAIFVIFAGLSIRNISFLEFNVNLNWFSFDIIVLNNIVELIFPGSLITIFWVIGVINVVNWVGGIDALNASVSSVSFIALIILALSSNQLSIAIVTSIYLGTVLGVLPFNYNPGKIMYGSIGDFMNGYLLAVFSILSNTRWAITLIILAIPILDGVYVFFKRYRNNKNIRKNPLKILSLSGRDHLHHRLLDSGFSQKEILFLELSIKILITSIVIFFTDIKLEYVGFMISISIFLLFLIIINHLHKINVQKNKIKILTTDIDKQNQNTESKQLEHIEKLVFKDKDDSEKEKFIY